MQMFRLALAVGMLVIGGVAVFLGLVVIGTALSKGAVSYSVVRDGVDVLSSVSKADDPSTFWRTIGLIGGLPVVVGVAAVVWGRRILKG